MGRQKVLLPFGPRTVLDHILHAIEGAGLGETVVVTGHQPEAVEAALDGVRARAVHNPDYPAGMLGSVRVGLRALRPESAGVMLFLGDQPRVTSELLVTLARAQVPGRGDLIVPVCGGRRGHPLLFDTIYRDEILGAYDSVGLRGVLHAHPDHIVEVPWDDTAILEDLDTPEQYAAALQRRE